MDFTSRVVPVFMLWLPKIFGSSILSNIILQYPKTVKELKWMVSVLEVYQCRTEDVKILRYNDSTPVAQAITLSYNMYTNNDTVSDQDMCHILELYEKLYDTKYNVSAIYKGRTKSSAH